MPSVEPTWIRLGEDAVSAEASTPAPKPSGTSVNDPPSSTEANRDDPAWATVEPFFVLQKAGGFVGPDPRGVAFATERVAAGADELRDLILSAWNASATMSVGYPAITLDQVNTGGVDACDPLYGEV